MSWLLPFISALGSIMNPVGNAGLFAGMTADCDSSISRQIASKCAGAILVILLVSTWAGDILLKAAGLDVYELRMGGGVIVLLIGLRMLFNDTSHAQTSDEAKAAETCDSIAVVPMAIPIVAGPGTISLVIATAGEHSALDDRIAMTAVCVVMALLTGCVFSVGKKIADWLGVSGMAVVTRIMGMVLASTAMGMLASGIRGLFPELFT